MLERHSDQFKEQGTEKGFWRWSGMGREPQMAEQGKGRSLGRGSLGSPCFLFSTLECQFSALVASLEAGTQ